MTEPYIRASELKDFAFCQRVWFLERATAVQRGRTLDGLGRLLLVLGLLRLAIVILVSALKR